MKAYRKTLVYTFYDGTQILEEDGDLPSSSINDELYRVGSEERLVDVAFAKYGDHEEWYGIALTNGIINPFEDLKGQQLIIPN